MFASDVVIVCDVPRVSGVRRFSFPPLNPPTAGRAGHRTKHCKSRVKRCPTPFFYQKRVPDTPPFRSIFIIKCYEFTGILASGGSSLKQNCFWRTFVSGGSKNHRFWGSEVVVHRPFRAQMPTSNLSRWMSFSTSADITASLLAHLWSK